MEAEVSIYQIDISLMFLLYFISVLSDSRMFSYEKGVLTGRNSDFKFFHTTGCTFRNQSRVEYA